MGGSIRVVIKKEDIFYKGVRWTNLLPDFVKNSKFILGDTDYLKEYIDKGKNSAYSYPGDNLLAPEDYGIDIFDFDNKKIYTIQEYCDYRYIEPSEVYLSFHQEDGANFIAELKEINTKGFLEILDITSDNKERISNRTLEELITRKNYNRDFILRINWEKAGWKIIARSNFTETFEEVKKQYELNSKELEVWAAFIKDEEI